MHSALPSRRLQASRDVHFQRCRIGRLLVFLSSALIATQWLCAWIGPIGARTVRPGATVRQGFGSVVKEGVESPESVWAYFDLDKYMSSRVKAVEDALDASVVSNSPYTAKIVESMRYSLLAGGKRIRPVLCLAGYEMIRGSDDAAAEAAREAMPLAVAIEMIHTMSLIHDDLPALDNDDLRRGKPTNHKIYGEDVAVLSGDALLSESFTHIVRATPKSVPAERILDVIHRLGDATGPVGLAGGQVMDVECEGRGSATVEDLQWIHEHKTAILLEISVVGGAVLAGATEDEIAACTKYAHGIGLAFQVADDILDVTATSEQLGKTAGKDEAVDKTTYVKLLGLEGARKEVSRLKKEAVDALAPFGDRAAPLLAIAEYIVERKN